MATAGKPTTARGGIHPQLARQRAIRPPHRRTTLIAGAGVFLG
jgi:hypothetical protein